MEEVRPFVVYLPLSLGLTGVEGAEGEWTIEWLLVLLVASRN